MNTGMLWFDNDPQIDIRAKINRAIANYQKKLKLFKILQNYLLHNQLHRPKIRLLTIPCHKIYG